MQTIKILAPVAADFENHLPELSEGDFARVADAVAEALIAEGKAEPVTE